MTASNTVVNDIDPVVQYTATSGQTIFDAPWLFFDDDDLTVYQTLSGATADDTTDLLVLTTNYTVTNTDTESGGTIVLNSGATTGDTITIYRIVSLDRLADYQSSGDMLAETLNKEQDTEMMALQQLRSDFNRTISLKRSEDASINPILPPAVPSKVFGWDSTGKALMNYNLNDGTDDAGNTNYTPPGTGAQNRNVGNKLNEFISITDYGAVAGGTAAVNTPAIQAAIDYANSIGGGRVYIPSGTYLITSQGTHDSLAYGLMLKSNVTLYGDGFTSIIKADDNTDMVVITDDRTAQSSNIGLFNFKIDGNSSNNTGADSTYFQFNIWIKNSINLVVDNLFSFDSAHFGMRFEQVTYSQFGVLQVDNETDGRDGIHLIDCNNVTFDKVLINTVGDDGFIINAENQDCHDISVGELVVTAPVTGAAGGRGVLLILSDVADAASTQRSIYNISIPNALTYNCKGASLLLDKAQFRNIHINCSDYGSGEGMVLQAGSSNVTGYIKNSSFTYKSWNSDAQSMRVTLVDGAVENNHLDLLAYNPGDGSVGLTLNGDMWTGNITVEYDPDGTKATPLQVLDVYGSYSNLNVTAIDGTRSINCRAGATYNTFKVGALRSASINSIRLEATADNNIFMGGSIDASISDLGTNTRFVGIIGGSGYGNSVVTPDANGQDTIAHGLQGTPTFVMTGLRGDNVNGVDVESADGTNLTIRIKDASGADVTSGSFTVDWEATL